METQPRTAHKVTLSSGRVVILFTPRQSDLNEATKEAGMLAGADNQAHLGLLMQQCLLRRLVHSVDGEVLTLEQKGNPDLFEISENSQLAQYTSNLTRLALQISSISISELESMTPRELHLYCDHLNQIIKKESGN